MRKETRKKGITLVETIVACGVITTLMVGVIPPSVKMVQQKAVQTTAQEMIAVQEAEKNYWIDKLNENGTGEWCGSIANLKSEGYLPSGWSGKNLFQQDYTISTTASTCSVQTTIPKGLEGVVQTHCPQVNVSYSGTNAIVSSTIPVPGQEPTMEALLHRTGDIKFRVAEEPVGSKKYIVAGTDVAEVESAIKRHDITEKPDIYSKALVDNKISSSGWLSDAKFPAQIDPEKTVEFSETVIIFLPPLYGARKTISVIFPSTVNVLEQSLVYQGITYSFSEESYGFSKRYSFTKTTPQELTPTSIYFKWQVSGKTYTLNWSRPSDIRKIVFSDNAQIWDPPTGFATRISDDRHTLWYGTEAEAGGTQIRFN